MRDNIRRAVIQLTQPEAIRKLALIHKVIPEMPEAAGLLAAVQVALSEYQRNPSTLAELARTCRRAEPVFSAASTELGGMSPSADTVPVIDFDTVKLLRMQVNSIAVSEQNLLKFAPKAPALDRPADMTAGTKDNPTRIWFER